MQASWKLQCSSIGTCYAILAIFLSIYLTFNKPKTVIYIDPLQQMYTYGDFPILGSKNASAVLQKRILEVQSAFEKVLERPRSSWTTLKVVKSLNLTIDVQDAAQGPQYVMSTIFIKAQTKTTFNQFSWANFDRTLSAIDPFYESTEALHKISNSQQIIRKVN